MLVGANNSGSDSNGAMHRLRSRKFLHVRGVGQDSCDFEAGCGGTAIYNPSPTSVSLPTLDLSSWGAAVGDNSLPSTTVSSTLSGSSSFGTALANMFSSLGASATRAFASTQTQCSVGTTLVGNQCLPTTAVNALIASSNPAFSASSLMSYAPLLIGLVVVVVVMNASHK